MANCIRMNFFSRSLVCGLSILVLLLCIGSVSPDLHSAIFHGEEGCPTLTCKTPCGSEEQEENEPPCPVLLFCQVFLFEDPSTDWSEPSLLVCEVDFFLPPANWVFYRRDPFGARDPPLIG